MVEADLELKYAHLGKRDTPKRKANREHLQKDDRRHPDRAGAEERRARSAGDRPHATWGGSSLRGGNRAPLRSRGVGHDLHRQRTRRGGVSAGGQQR